MKNSKLKLFIIFVVFAVVLSIVTILTEKFFFGNHAQKVALKNAIYKTQEREAVFKEFLNQSKNTLHSLRELNSFKKYLDNNKYNSDLENLFLAYAKSQPSFMKVRFIDKNGFEKIRVDRDKESKKPFITPQTKLQNKADRYYFYDSKTKPLEKVWFSPLDLNVENGKVEIPYRPTMRAILPIKHNGEFSGILIINYLMDDFLEKFTYTPLYTMMLCDDRGYTLYHHKKDKSWGQYLDPKYNISSDFPKDYKQIIEKDLYITDELVSRKLDLGISGGLNLVLQLQNSYIKKQETDERKHYIVIASITFFASLILTFFIIQFFSKTLFNLEKLSKLNRELKQQSLRKELALKTGTIGVWEWTFSTNRLVWDDMMYQIYGIKDKKQDSSYTMWSNAIDKEDKPKVEANLLNAKETNAEYNIQFWITTPSGERKYIHAIGHNEFDENHTAYRMVGINKDITEFYRTQEQVIFKAKELELANHALEASYNNIKQQKDEFESLFRESRDGIAIMDLTSKFLDFNEAYLDMVGYTPEELREKTCIDLSVPEEKEKSIQAFEIALETGYLKNLEKTCITKNGNRIVVNMSATLLPDKKRLLLVTKDVSSLKLLEEQSKLASMGEMIGNIAHQWRQPLSVISSASTGMQVQKEYGLLTDEKFNESCDAINKNAQYLSKTIDDFRNFIKGDRNKVVFDLNNEITSFLHLVEGSIKNHHINIILNLQNDIEILGYENELTQCFINIFNNAKDALKDNSEENRVIFISTIKKGQNVIITIKDNAGGIPQDILPKIFEPYFTTKHQSQGTGLGLSMSYKLIVDGMDGTIEASNKEFEYNGKTYLGAEFTITLPCN